MGNGGLAAMERRYRCYQTSCPCPVGWLDLLAYTWINISSLPALIYWLIHQDAIATKRKVHLRTKKVLCLSNSFLMAERQ